MRKRQGRARRWERVRVRRREKVRSRWERKSVGARR